MQGNPYQTRRYLDEYLLFHYGRSRDVCPFNFVPGEALRFHERLRRECLLPLPSGNRAGARIRGQHEGQGRLTRALDIGCAVGRFTFELSRVVDQAVGIDNSASFIEAAQRLAKRRSVTVRVKESGRRASECRLVLPAFFRGSMVKFQVGDALNLSEFGKQSFEIVAAINLLCRLPSPRRFLSKLHRLVVPRGQLVLASPFTWLKEHTPEGEWLNSSDITRLLAPYFRLARRRDLPFLIREHERKYQLVITEVMTFRREDG